MQQPYARDREMQYFRDLLSTLSEASLRINENLDPEAVLQKVLDSARSLTDAWYAVITTFDELGEVEDLLTSGLTDEETQSLYNLPGGAKFFEHVSNLTGPLRVNDFVSYLESAGLSEYRSPKPVQSFLVCPMRHEGQYAGIIYLSKGSGRFSQDEEHMLGMLATQSALVMANARRHRDERKARVYLETLIDTSPVGVVVVDAKTGMPTSLNQETRRILSQLQAQGSELDPDLHTPRLDTLIFRRADGREIATEENPLTQALRAGETVRAEEVVIQALDGRSVPVLINATPVPAGCSEVESVIFTLQDMTPVKNMDRLRAEFLSMVSHELRQPLSSIKGSAVSLRESLNSLDPAEMVQFLRIIESQSDRMRDLIGELLDVARIKTGTLSVALEPTEVSTLVESARSNFLTGNGGRNIALDLEQNLPWVMADNRRLVQVIDNLLSNAARYSQENSVIRLSGSLKNGYVTLSVTDKGRGIEPDRLPLLFRTFSGVDDDWKREVPASGLGLAICKGIVEAHGGRIWAESKGVGFGSRFTFTVPVAEVTAVQAAPHSLRSLPETEKRERILVVDDDPMNLRYVRDILTNEGYTLVTTGDPDEALRLFKAERPQLILLDLLLPGIDGIQLMDKMFRIERAPVIFLSAYVQDEIIARAFESGAVDYVTKPFSSTELVARVRGAMRRRLNPNLDESPPPFVLGDLTLDYVSRTVTLSGSPVHLTPTEYELLSEFSLNSGRVLTFDYLLGRVWGEDRPVQKGMVRTYVKRLRRKLGEEASSPKYIFAEPHVGYRMAQPEGA